jgi:transcriptional regulator with XRE-family HTH domain
MKDQLVKLMDEKGLTPTQFADIIGIQRPRLSHILNERNKPGYDFILSVLNAFKDINAEWLITGNGEMLKEISALTSNSIVEPNQNSFQREEKDLFTNEVPQKNKDKSEEKIKEIAKDTNVNHIDRIVIFYSNGIFKEYLSE